MPWGNLYNWLLGSARDREFAELRQRWAETEALWQASRFPEYRLIEEVWPAVHAAAKESSRRPADSIVLEACRIADRLLYEEYLDYLEPDWWVIEHNPSVAIEMRELIAKRSRWVTNFDYLFGLYITRIREGWAGIFRMLPRACDGNWQADDDFFGVPLIDLVAHPGEFVEALWQLPRSPATLQNDLCLQVRDQLGRNALEASGIPIYEDLTKYRGKLLWPRDSKIKPATELARTYLKDSPLLPFTNLVVPFHIADEARFEHCHIVGGTGHGKTQLMQRMIHYDLVAAARERRSVVVIDSQGDLINKLMRLDLFDPGREDSLADRLIIIDPSDVEFPCSLNLFDHRMERLAAYKPADRERVLNGVIELYEIFFSSMLGAELTQKQGVIFRYLARLMLIIPDATIHTLMRLMEDGKPFKPYMQALDGSARYFFEREFFQPSFSATKQQILKRLWGVLSTPAFERMFAQPTNKLDLFEALNEGKIILISTAKDMLKNEGSALFGRFFIAMLAQATLERSTLLAEKRTPTYCYIDEAQEYFDDSIETILNQARKYKVGLTLAHQTLDQLSPRLRSAMLANTSLKCVGGVSSKDASTLAGELRTTSDFIESMQRHGDRTEFAVWLKHETPRAIRLSIPLGFLERQPLLDEEAFETIIMDNRLKYACALEYLSLSSFAAYDQEGEGETESPVRRRDPAPRSERAPEREPSRLPERQPEHPTAVERPALAATARPRAARPNQERELGKGGSQHRYVQHLIKGLAEERGFRAVVEAPVAGGQVDVALYRESLSIACEISVTSTAAYEAQNLSKCITAGFGYVFAIANDVKRLKKIETSARAQLEEEDLAKVLFLTPDTVAAALDDFAKPTEETSVVRGYRVKVSRTDIGTAEARQRRASVARIVAESLKNLPKK